MDSQNLLEIKDLKTYFYTQEGVVKAVDGISLSINKGKTLGVVGESGCGKSVTALSIMKLIESPPGKIVDGEIIYKNQNLVKFSEKEMQKIRGNNISMIFQEPMTSLNPVFTIGNQIEEAIKLHQRLSKKERKEKTIEMLKIVGISDPDKRINDYPHLLSGGMRQKVMIAMALACNPDLLIADEPTTALDVTIQAQILDLIKNIKSQRNMSMMLITHDLGIVAENTDDVAVMYAGKIVEKTSTDKIFKEPAHPYTVALQKSIPETKIRSQKRLNTISGNVPNLYNLPNGCAFQERCACVMPVCKQLSPKLVKITEDHLVSCHKYKQK